MESSNLGIGVYGKVKPLGVQETTQNPNNIKKPNVAVAISLTLLLALIVGALIGALIHESATESTHQLPPTLSSPPTSLDSNASKSLKIVCSVTQHPDFCFTTISPLNINSPDKADPVHFFNLSLQVTIQEVMKISSLPKSLIRGSTADKGTESALKDCVSLFDDAASEISKSLDEMEVGPNERVLTEMKVSDMQTWISAAMTDQETCLQGLEETESSLVNEVKVKVQKSKYYIGISLAIINNMETLLQQFGMTLVN